MTMTANHNHKNKAQHTTTATSHFSITGNEMSLTLTLHFLLLTQPFYLSANHSSLNLFLFSDSPLFSWDLCAFRLLPFFRFCLSLLFQIVAKFGTESTCVSHTLFSVMRTSVLFRIATWAVGGWGKPESNEI